MNPHAAQPTSIAALGKSLWSNRRLILQMTRRNVLGRYKGSFLGLAWSFVNPFLMLATYTFVFSLVLKAKWGDGEDISNAGFAVIVFVGMIVHGLVAETLNAAPSLILNNVNFVKKIVFPLEALPVIALGAALFHATISFTILIVAFILLNGIVHWTIIFTPLVIAPLILVTLGFAWFLASLGVFLRDVGQTVGIFTSALLFLSPVFYPMTAVPEALRSWMMLNPLAFIIEQTRRVVITGLTPDWTALGVYFLSASAVAWIGFAWFQKTRKGFADVL